MSHVVVEYTSEGHPPLPQLPVSELASDDDDLSKWGQHLIRDGPNETDSI